MNLIKMAAIIYRTYIDRGIDIPYFRTIMTIQVLILFHLFQLLFIFHYPVKWIFPWNTTDKNLRWFFAISYLSIWDIILMALFSKKKLENINVSNEEIIKGKKILPIYLFLNTFILILLSIIYYINYGVK